MVFARIFEKAKNRSSQQKPKNNKRSLRIPTSASSSATKNSTRKRPRDSSKKQRPSKRIKQAKRPSEAALLLTSQLKACSSKKLLQQALDLYWDPKNKAIIDNYHACVAIDCCARCGDMKEAEKISASLASLSVETKTCLIKGYVHGGQIEKAARLFESMCLSICKADRPNVRTLNTLLRGCLWAASTLNSQDQVFGGVITSEHAWSLYRTKVPDATFDISSYEYSVLLLCQALRTEQARERLEDMKVAYSVDVSHQGVSCSDHTALEAFAAGNIGLGRAFAMLGRKDEATAAFTLSSKTILALKALQGTDHHSPDSKSRGTRGEKRSWRGQDARRDASNTIFRSHRLAEMSLELESLTESCRISETKGELAERLVQSLLYFSGGGTTGTDATSMELSAQKKQVEKPASGLARGLRRHLANALWHSFGLKAAYEQGQFEMKLKSDFVRVKDSERIFRLGGNVGAIRQDGFISFDHLFSGEIKPIDIELGAGFGDWIVHQASRKPDRNFVAVELRADRVGTIFTKATLRVSGPLRNVCVVGSECGSFLQERVRPGSVTSIYANHPEPPTQVCGDDSSALQSIMNGGAESGHMLSAANLVAAAACLKTSPAGRIVIVTDSMSYARLLGATIIKAIRHHKCPVRSLQMRHEKSALRVVERFPVLLDGSSSNENVYLLQGQPCEEIGHAEANSSYFDRLWRTGASSHASSQSRYIIALERKV